MFVYLAREGRYWLRGAVLTFILSLCISGFLPALSSFVPASIVGPSEAWAQGKAPPRGTPSQDNRGNRSQGNRSGNGTGDRNPSNRGGRGYSMDPSMPSGRSITGGNEASRAFFKPWISPNIPWDGNWGAFNSNLSERLGGTCVLDEQDQKYWGTFLGKMESAQTKITSTGSDARREFQKALKKEMSDDGGPGQIATTLLSGSADSLGSYDELLQLSATSQQLAGCNRNNNVLSAWAKGFVPNPLNIFKHPSRFIAQLVWFLPAMIGYGVFQIVAPFAFGLALNTPHSERGDNLTNSFAVTAASGAATTSKAQALSAAANEDGDNSNNLGDLAVQQDCVTANGTTNDTRADQTFSGDAQLGIKCDNLNPERQADNAWISIANSLRSALSAVYGIIVISVALLYLFRRNSQSQYHIKVILPRLFLAVIMTMAAPFAIGALITLSNWTVAAIFQSLPGSVPQQLMQAIASLTVMTGLDQGFMAVIAMSVPTLVLLLADVVSIYLILIAVGKQLLLIALIITCPIACLAFVFRDHGKNLFSFWTKGLLAVVFLPVALGAVLGGGLILMNAFWNQTGNLNSDGADWSWGIMDVAMRYVAALILVATLIGLIKVVGAVRQWATGNKVGMLGKMGGTATKLAGAGIAAAGAASGNPMAAAAGRQIASAASTAGSAMQRGSQRGSWIPQSSGTLSGATSRRSGGGGMLESGIGKLTDWGREKENATKLIEERQQREDEKAEREGRSTGGTSGGASGGASGGSGRGSGRGSGGGSGRGSGGGSSPAPERPLTEGKYKSVREILDEQRGGPGMTEEEQRAYDLRHSTSASDIRANLGVGFRAQREKATNAFRDSGLSRVLGSGRIVGDTGSFSRDQGLMKNAGVLAKKQANAIGMATHPKTYVQAPVKIAGGVKTAAGKVRGLFGG